jgi:hypothetical protein
MLRFAKDSECYDPQKHTVCEWKCSNFFDVISPDAGPLSSADSGFGGV